jgi:hypothetical protein
MPAIGPHGDPSGRQARVSEPVNLLMLEFLGWVAARPRTHAEAMEAWRSGCPRQSVWEDALAEALIRIGDPGMPDSPAVTLTARGRALLEGSDGRHARRGTAQ